MNTNLSDSTTPPKTAEAGTRASWIRYTIKLVFLAAGLDVAARSVPESGPVVPFARNECAGRSEMSGATGEHCHVLAVIDKTVRK